MTRDRSRGRRAGAGRRETATTTMTTTTTTTMARAMRGARVARDGRATTRAPGRARRARVAAQMGPELRASIDAFVAENRVVLFMKGTKDAPRCGFSNTCVQILNSMNVPFADVDILANEDLRQGMKCAIRRGERARRTRAIANERRGD